MVEEGDCYTHPCHSDLAHRRNPDTAAMRHNYPLRVPHRLASGQYSLILADLYERMWSIAHDDPDTGDRIYRPRMAESLKWLVHELSGAPASKGGVSNANTTIRHRAERILVEEGWAEVYNDRGYRLLRNPWHGEFMWPTVEWVKEPVDLETGNRSGARIRMRHFLDCIHWHREAGSDRLLGQPPTLATDNQMSSLPACKSCVARAKALQHEDRGPRISSTTPIVTLDPDPPIETDRLALVALRREQQYLRKHLIGDHSEALCSICGRELPTRLLVAAHIVPRRMLSEPERLSFGSAAMLACKLGCDALFEDGFIAVDPGGRVIGHRHTSNSAVFATVSALEGRSSSAFSSLTAKRFEQHRSHHEQAGTAE